MGPALSGTRPKRDMTSARPVGFCARMRMRIAKRERRFAGHHVYTEHLGYSGVFSVIGVLAVRSAPTSACGSRRARGASRGLQAAPHRTALRCAASQWLACGKESVAIASVRTWCAAWARGLTWSDCLGGGCERPPYAKWDSIRGYCAWERARGLPPGRRELRAEAGGCRRVQGGMAGRSGPQGGLEWFLR